MHLLQHLQVLALAQRQRRRAPLADTIHGQHGRLPEGAWIEGRGRVAQVVLGEQQLLLGVELGRELLQLLGEQTLLEQLLAQPDGHGHAEG